MDEDNNVATVSETSTIKDTDKLAFNIPSLTTLFVLIKTEINQKISEALNAIKATVSSNASDISNLDTKMRTMQSSLDNEISTRTSEIANTRTTLNQTITNTDTKLTKAIKDAQPHIVSVVLSASGWNSSKQQTVTVDGVSSDESAQLIWANPSSATLANSNMYFNCGVALIAQGPNSLTFKYSSLLPTDNITVLVSIQAAVTA